MPQRSHKQGGTVHIGSDDDKSALFLPREKKSTSVDIVDPAVSAVSLCVAWFSPISIFALTQLDPPLPRNA